MLQKNKTPTSLTETIIKSITLNPENWVIEPSEHDTVFCCTHPSFAFSVYEISDNDGYDSWETYDVNYKDNVHYSLYKTLFDLVKKQVISTREKAESLQNLKFAANIAEYDLKSKGK